MLKLEAARYHFGTFRLEASFVLEAGKLTAVLGPSGAGKSTLLNIIAGFEPLASGRLEIDEADFTLATPAARPVSMVFQDNNVFPHLSLWQNVALGLSPGLNLSASQSAAVDQALERVGLSALMARKPAQVSGGERQRVALARVLVRPTKVLLLDEPFAALDPGLRAAMLGLVKELTVEHHLSTLLVTHQPDEIRAAADGVLFVHDGKVGPVQDAERFFASTAPEVLSYLGRGPTSRVTSTSA